MRNGAKHHPIRRRVLHRHRVEAKQRVKRVKQRIELPALPEQPVESINTGEAAISTSPIAGGQPLQRKHSFAEDLHDWILGGQDGLVNVLGSLMGVAIVTTQKEIVLVAGLASLCAESISMAAVAYTSVKASHSYYHSEHYAQRKLIEENPVLQREILIDIYEHKGLSRADAQRVVAELTKDKAVWLQTMMEEHLHMAAPEETGPAHSAIVVGLASLLGSAIPLLPFFFLSGIPAILWSSGISVTALFGLGAMGAKLTIGDWKARGVELALIGGTAAAVSVLIGWVFVSGIIPVG
jgi:VIT1/CCC1 family predicted Fe2+/Mn2+ transporter